MDDYSYAAQQLKELIVTEYLRKHPNVKRTDVITRMVNGRVVLSHIDKVFKESVHRTPRRSISDQRILKELSAGGDERYVRCLDSISTSQTYIDWLAETPGTGFAEREKLETVEYLNRKEEICANRALDMASSQRQFQAVMGSKTEPDDSLSRTLMAEYFNAFLSQLKSQFGLYTKEVDLGDRFYKFSKKVLEAYYEKKIRSQEPLMDLHVRIQSALNVQKLDTSKLSTETFLKKVDDDLHLLGDKLQSKRKELTAMRELIVLIEDVVEVLAKSEKKSKPKEGGTTRRMAYSSKKKINPC